MQHRVPIITLLLLLFIGLVSLLPVASPVLASNSSPGAGWVAAGAISGGCWDNGTCSSSVSTVVDGLFEYYPDARHYNAGVGPAPNHGGFPTYVDRGICHQGTSYEKSAAGTWHHGATWSKVIRVTIDIDPTTGRKTSKTTVTWDGPKKSHWAFYHDYKCSDVPVPTNTPTAEAGANDPGDQGGGSGSPSAPTATPYFDIPQEPTAIPTPLPTLTPSSGPCVSELGEQVPRGVIPISSEALDGRTYSIQESGYRTDYPPEDEPQPEIISTGVEREVAWDLRGLDDTPDSRAKHHYTPQHSGQSYFRIGLRDVTTGVDLFLFDTENIHWTTSGIPDYTLRPNRVVFAEDVANTSDALFASWNRAHDTWQPDSQTNIPRAHNNYLRYMGVMRVRFTPQPGHVYDVYAVAGFEACCVSYPRWSRLLLHTNATNVAIQKIAPPFTVANSLITYQLEYRNTEAMTAAEVTIVDQLPAGLTFHSASPNPTNINGNTLSWSLGSLPGHTSGTIWLYAQVNPNATGAIANTARISTITAGDQPGDNISTTTTQIATPPTPEADLKLRIHSEFDPQHNVHTSDGVTISWPAGETMDFTPYATLEPVSSDMPGIYRFRQRIIGWNLVAINGAPAEGQDSMGRSGCRSRALPTEDVGPVEGCAYAYVFNPNRDDMHNQAHMFWSTQRPKNKPDSTYVYVGQPLNSSTITVDVVIATEIIDDQPDSSTNGLVLYTTTTKKRGVFNVTLLVPRSTK